EIALVPLHLRQRRRRGWRRDSGHALENAFEAANGCANAFLNRSIEERGHAFLGPEEISQLGPRPGRPRDHAVERGPDVVAYRGLDLRELHLASPAGHDHR